MTNKDYSNALQNKNSAITVEDSTRQAYHKKAEQLKKRAIKELGIQAPDIDPRQFVMWLIDNRSTINKNSYRVYKSSIISYLIYVIGTPIALEAAQFLIRKNSDFSYKKSNKTSAKKAKKINEKFGNFETFKAEFNKKGAGQFGSGWVWLVCDKEGNIEVVSTPNQDSPISCGKIILLGNDVWEHAYYVKYRNVRPDYIKAFFSVINWNKVNELYAAAK